MGREAMATSACVKCGEHLFELVEMLPAGAVNKLQLLQCASCGTPVGVHEDNSAILTKLTVAIAQLKAQVTEIDAGLRRIVEFLNEG
jgi:hypothetical protein